MAPPWRSSAARAKAAAGGCAWHSRGWASGSSIAARWMRAALPPICPRMSSPATPMRWTRRSAACAICGRCSSSRIRPGAGRGRRCRSARIRHNGPDMDFQLTPEQEEFRGAVRRFAEKHLAPGALERAHAPGYPWDVAKLMAKQGLLGITIPETSGGQGGTLLDALLAIETVASVCPRSADVVQAGNFGPIRVLAEYGSAAQKQRYLERLLAGETVISVGMTEPDAGSAVTDLKTSATRDGEGWRINGSKIFTTHSAYAEVFLVYVRYAPGVGGIGSVLVEKKDVRLGKTSRFMSGEEWAQIYLDNAYVPPENVLLGEGGFKKQIAGFNVERIGNAARSVALGRYAFETARAWALERRQFGRLLC